MAQSVERGHGNGDLQKVIHNSSNHDGHKGRGREFDSRQRLCIFNKTEGFLKYGVVILLITFPVWSSDNTGFIVTPLV